MSDQDPEAEVRERGLPTFHESAKKFKRGPVAPAESEADRLGMSGAAPTAAAAEKAADDPAASQMSDGEPGRLKEMPGE
jgi:hypothetical protein